VLGTVVGPAQADALQREPADFAALLDTTWNWLCAEPETRRLLTLGDPLYPQRLLETEDPPLLLYAIGAPDVWRLNLLNACSDCCLAVVGSRNPTPQGLANARHFSDALAQAGLTVVSGMALGVDGAAHEGALQGAAPGALATVAVVGTGLDRVYPKQHRTLAHRIAQQGAILSEFALGTGPLAPHFPQRNRIISGLARGTLVVEAALLSGSLITAKLAAEQGREVFAIPGSIHATQSRGCHALIKQGAKLVESAQDILEELQFTAFASSPSTSDGSREDAALPPNSASQSEPPLLVALGFDASSLDALQARTGLATPDLLAQLMTLELEGRVARLPGGLFQRVVLA
jgi:DNA processing protein